MLKLIYSMAELDAEQLIKVYRLQNPEDAKLLSYLREIFFTHKGAFYAIWEEESVYKSVVRFGPYKDGLLLHSLETDPEERRKGYASRLLTEVLRYLQSTDCKVVYSHIDKRNKVSLALHRKCSFQIVADSATYLDGTVTQNAWTLRNLL